MKQPTLFSQTASAVLSTCRRYRYRLARTWDDALPTVCWIMLNPSTADAEQDDPTIRRCVGFARAWGAGSITVVNLFAWRATDPGELAKVPDPVGPGNDCAIASEAVGAPLVVAAWGAHPMARHRGAQVAGRLSRSGVTLQCLGLTKIGAMPRHPLYVPAAAKLVPYKAVATVGERIGEREGVTDAHKP